eukprot:751177-Hanusia_phi.AAC.1
MRAEGEHVPSLRCGALVLDDQEGGTQGRGGRDVHSRLVDLLDHLQQQVPLGVYLQHRTQRLPAQSSGALSPPPLRSPTLPPSFLLSLEPVHPALRCVKDSLPGWGVDPEGRMAGVCMDGAAQVVHQVEERDAVVLLQKPQQPPQRLEVLDNLPDLGPDFVPAGIELPPDGDVEGDLERGLNAELGDVDLVPRPCPRSSPASAPPDPPAQTAEGPGGERARRMKRQRRGAKGGGGEGEKGKREDERDRKKQEAGGRRQ